jgi:hypothetical protein
MNNTVRITLSTYLVLSVPDTVLRTLYILAHGTILKTLQGWPHFRNADTEAQRD